MNMGESPPSQATESTLSVSELPQEVPCTKCLKGTMKLVEDEGTLWYVCNNKHCMLEEEVVR